MEDGDAGRLVDDDHGGSGDRGSGGIENLSANRGVGVLCDGRGGGERLRCDEAGQERDATCGHRKAEQANRTMAISLEME